MISVGRYLVFILSGTGMILSNDQFTDEKTREFLQEIFRQHNVYRNTYRVKALDFDKTLSKKAGILLKDVLTLETEDSSEGPNDVIIFLPFDDDIEQDDNADLEEYDNYIITKTSELMHYLTTGEKISINGYYGYNFIYLPYNEVIKLDENLANKIVSSWYDTGDSRQIVWAKTERMGLAMAKSDTIEHIAILVYYYPPEN